MENVEDSTEEDTLEKQCVRNLRVWVETEAKFEGRTDDEFLLIFLRGCKFNTEKCKKKLNAYYENRKKVPQWWTNRNLDSLQAVNQHKPSIVLFDTHSELPSITITIYSRFGNDANLFDAYCQQHSIMMDLAIRRANCQRNGVVWVLDFKDYPTWVLYKLINPNVLYKIFNSFYLAIPIRLKSVHVVNFPAVGRVVWRLIRQVLSEKMRKRFHFYDSDFSSLRDHIDVRLLPVEYGGSNGSLEDHEVAFDREMRAFSDYMINDEKYGFK